MGDLTRDFSRHEFRCKCGCGEDNMDMNQVRAIQKLRNLIDSPIIINSGIRCPAHNKAVGGAPFSYHLFGQASDICVGGWTPDALGEMAKKVEEFNQGGIIVYPERGFVHLDIRNNGPYHRTEGE